MKLERFFRSLKGQLFTNACTEEISIVAKLMYFGLTTLAGSKTLGEEYVDLVYVSRTGKELVKRYKKLLFVLSYALGPLVVSRILRRWGSGSDDSDSKDKTYSYRRILDIFLNVHLVLFYFSGSYYDVIKRILGMRYAIGHKVNPNEAKFRTSNSNTYKFLGHILLLKVASEKLPATLQYLKKLLVSEGTDSANDMKVCGGNGVDASHYYIKGIPDESRLSHIDLSDKSQLPFIPEVSRTCILCLNLMVDPSCTPCGHLFCWNCIVSWCKERAECPLCRQKSHPQQVLSIR